MNRLGLCGAAAFLLTVSAYSESFAPAFSDKGWSLPSNVNVDGNAVDLPADSEKRTTISFCTKLDENTVYEVRFNASGKNAASPKDSFVCNTSVAGSYTERPFTGEMQKFRMFLFNDTAGMKSFWFSNRSRTPGNVLRLSDISVEKLTPENGRKITLDEPLAWDVSGWSRPYTTYSTVDASDHVDGGRAMLIEISGEAKPGAGASLRSCPIPFAPDTDYEISAWIKSDAPGIASLGFDSGFPGNYKHYYKTEKFPVGTEWRKQTFRFKTPGEKEYTVFELGRTRGLIALTCGKEAKKLYVKNWTIEKIQ